MKIEVLAEEAERLYDWIANRGGIAVWQSLDLGNPDARTFTPADVTTPPSWRYGSTPAEIVTDRAEITVYTETLYKAFAVGLKQKGMTLVLTDAAQRKVDTVMAACRETHGNANYRRGVLPDKAASIGVFYAC